MALSMNQLDALTALCFNVGLGGPGVKRGFYESKMRAKINAGDFSGAANEFDDWVHSNGKRLPGLVERRRIERRHFESWKA
jgi:lysozyme